MIKKIFQSFFLVFLIFSIVFFCVSRQSQTVYANDLKKKSKVIYKNQVLNTILVCQSNMPCTELIVPEGVYTVNLRDYAEGETALKMYRETGHFSMLIKKWTFPITKDHPWKLLEWKTKPEFNYCITFGRKGSKDNGTIDIGKVSRKFEFVLKK